MAQLINNFSEDKKLFFIALLPPTHVQQYVTKIKQHFADIYQSKAALKSPPHITLQPPFKWDLNNLKVLEKTLSTFTQNYASIFIELAGYSAFKPRVIYINVNKTPELLNIKKELNVYLDSELKIADRKSNNRPFCPHLTVGFRDLSKTNFYRAWDEFKEKKIYFDFTVNQLTLLLHNGQKWQIQSEFNLSD